MKAVRAFFNDVRAFDSAVLVLLAGFVLGAYVTSYGYVSDPYRVRQPYASLGQAILLASWLALTVLLSVGFATGLRRGRPWIGALPDGYIGTLVAALVFGGAWIVDSAFWSPAIGGNSLGLDVLYTPPRLVEVAAAAVMVAGPLRAAARRGETRASVVTLLSAALLLSTLTFATQYIHPLIDPWPASSFSYRSQVPWWVPENLGMAAILAQSALLAATGLLLNSGFELRPGSLTLVFMANGALVTITKTHFDLLPVAAATGVTGDVWLAWTARRPGRPSASLCAVIGGTFASAYAIEIALVYGSAWSISLWLGAIIAATALCWMMGRLLRAGLPAAIVAPLVRPVPLPVESHNEVRWTRDPASTVRPQLVRAALDDLGTPEALGRSPLGQLPGVSQGGSAATGSTASNLRAVLVDVISELAVSPSARDAEAGHLLLDYYVKKVGSHEVIMERLHLSRPTFYRRLQRGFSLVAERLDEMSEFASTMPIGDR